MEFHVESSTYHDRNNTNDDNNDNINGESSFNKQRYISSPPPHLAPSAYGSANSRTSSANTTSDSLQTATLRPPSPSASVTSSHTTAPVASYLALHVVTVLEVSSAASAQVAPPMSLPWLLRSAAAPHVLAADRAIRTGNRKHPSSQI